MNVLPIEIVAAIFEFLDREQFLACTRLCRYLLSRRAQSPMLSYHLSHRAFIPDNDFYSTKPVAIDKSVLVVSMNEGAPMTIKTLHNKLRYLDAAHAHVSCPLPASLEHLRITHAPLPAKLLKMRALRFLELGHSVVQITKLPPVLNTLILADYDDDTLDVQWPATLTTFIIKSRRNVAMAALPPSITHLSCTGGYQGPLPSPLPSTLRQITLGDMYVSPLPMQHLEHLTHLTLGRTYGHELAMPPSLVHLVVGAYYTHPIVACQLRHVTCPHPCLVVRGGLPGLVSCKIILIGGDSGRPVHLPSSLVHLEVEGRGGRFVLPLDSPHYITLIKHGAIIEYWS